MLTIVLLRYCESESLSEEGLRDLFERHGVAPNNSFPENYVDAKVFLILCLSGKITEGIIRCFLDYVPAASCITDEGMTPLHLVVSNERVSLSIFQLLFNAAPNSVRSTNGMGAMPLHHLCSGGKNEATAVEIVKFLIEKYPEAVRHVDNDGCLPLHYACQRRSPEFCRVLVEAYPGSERIPYGEYNILPLVGACIRNDLATIEYFYNLYPDDIIHRTTDGGNPILLTIAGMDKRTNPITAVEIVEFLLDRNPNLSTTTFEGRECSLLFAASHQILFQNLDIEAGLQIIKLIFDAHPEAIEGNDIALNLHNWNQQIQTFINSQLVYARQARDSLTTPDDNGQLPLHTALQNNVRLGSIKLLVKGNPTAVHSPDNRGSLPLHVACLHHDSTAIIQYLVGLDTTALEAVDNKHNTALHYACSGAKYETITMMLEMYDAVSISKQNAEGKLPLDLLLESNEVVDRKSIEYIETIFRLLRAYPETVMNYNVYMNEEGASASDDDFSTQNKRRKLALD